MKFIEKDDLLIMNNDSIDVGYIDFDINPEDNSVFINFFEVYKYYRGFGLGKFMLVEMVSYFKRKEFKTIFLEVSQCYSNIDLKSFYKSVGFSEVYSGMNILRLSL